MKGKMGGFVIVLAAIVVIFFVLQNENVRQSLGPFGDFMAAHGKIVYGIVIGGLLIGLFIKNRGRSKDDNYMTDNNYMTTEGTVWDAREDKIIIKYTVGSREYEKHEFNDLENVKDGAKYTVFYNPQDPNDCYVQRNETIRPPMSNMPFGIKK